MRNFIIHLFLISLYFFPVALIGNPLFINDTLRTVKLLFVGDVMGHHPQIKSAEVQKNKNYNYKPCFQYLRPIIQQADLAIANLEVTLPGAPPYRGYPIFRSPNDLAKDLKWAGFDILTTANNHANDARDIGLVRTIETLKNLGFHQTGTFKNKKERAIFYPLIINKNGIKLAFLNYTYDTNGIRTIPPTIVNGIYLNTIQKDIEKAKRLKADAIIVLMHWGAEYQLIENKRQRYLADWLVKQGADLVIGAHPHVVQPIEERIINAPNQKPRKVLIAYSLGNFISNQNKKNTDGGIILEVELTKNKQQQKTAISKSRFIPIWRYIQQKNNKTVYRALPISAFESAKNQTLNISKADKIAMKDFARSTRTRLRYKGAKERFIQLDKVFKRKKFALK